MLRDRVRRPSSVRTSRSLTVQLGSKVTLPSSSVTLTRAVAVTRTVPSASGSIRRLSNQCRMVLEP